MRETKSFLIVAIVCFFIIAIFGCNYDEGDDIAAETWPKMTAQEKIIYDKVNSQWGQRSLMHLREAIRNRQIKPNEKSIPFIDIANVVITTNNSLEFASSDTDSTKVKKDKARFNNVDTKWYRRLLGEGNNEQEIYEVTVIETTSKETQEEKPNIVYGREKPEPEPKPSEDELLKEKDIFDLRMRVRDCKPAISIIQNVASKNRPLTISDKSDIMYEISICETKRLSERFN